MSQLTRRTIVTGGVAATAAVVAGRAGIAPPSAQAAAPAAGKQAPSFYRYKIGDYEVTVVNDGVRHAPLPDGLVRNVSKDQVIAAAEAAYMPKGQLSVPFNPIVVNTGSQLILIDTGWGEGFAPTLGHMLTTMSAAGIDPARIDTVLISHMHPDHANGLKRKDGSLAFPNAEIKVPAVDWAFWSSDDNMSKAPNDLYKNYFANNRKVFDGLASKVTQFEWGKEAAPGITAIASPGHTPGHTAFAIASGSARVLVQGDITNVPDLFLRNPDWHVMFDYDPVQAAATRRKFHDMAAAEKAQVMGFHFPFPGLGYVEKDGNGYRLIPAAWNPIL
jgi:glyoxylase-like metal-dependent hydrolase (beta-lactamase superfamily II)